MHTSLRGGSRSGFTLIELLVVIAIIGIMSAIVIAALDAARNKSADAAIKQDLRGVQSQAEIFYYGNGNSYGSQATTTSAAGAGCGTSGMLADVTVVRQVVAASNASAASVSVAGTAAQNTICGSGQGYWAIATVLKTDNTKMWCIDSTGKVGLLSTIPASVAAFTGC